MRLLDKNALGKLYISEVVGEYRAILNTVDLPANVVSEDAFGESRTRA